MDRDYSPDLITLIDESGKEHDFEILDTLEENGRVFYALMPVYEDKTDLLYNSGDFTILEAVDDSGEEELAEVDDRELRNRLRDLFEDRFNDMFYN